MKTYTSPPKISVVGAGILGLTCAYVLTRRFGQDNITLHDRAGFPADNASFMAGGMLTPYSELDHLPASFLAAGLEGIRFWQSFAQECHADFEFAQNGSLLLAHDNDRYLLERFKSILPVGEDWELIERLKIDMLEPQLGEKFAQGLYIPAEAHLNPQKLMHLLCMQIQNKIEEDFDLNIKFTDTEWVVDCRGMSARADEVNLRGVKGETLIVRNPEFFLSRPVRLMHPRYPLYIVPRADQVFMIGATIIESEENSNVSLRSGLELMSAAFSLHPSFADAEILEIKSGVRPAYPDNLPHIYVKDNILICNGMYRHGYLLAPIMAKCIESQILNQHNEFISLFLKDKNYADHTKWKATCA